MKDYFLTPINVDKPPHHTIIKPRCFTCSKFPVCSLRTDYLKTALLIQNILGNPQEDRELGYYNSSIGYIFGYKGFDITNGTEYFPAAVNTTENQEGTYLESKYRDENILQFIYVINDYYVVFNAIYNKEKEKFNITKGKEVYYHLKFELSATDIQTISDNLLIWRQEYLDKEEENKDMDIINTTYFSANLNCDFYNWEKGLTEEEGIKRIIAKYPKGIPCGDGKYYHLATFHVEPHKVPLYHPEVGKVAFAPMPYPVFIPPKCKKKTWKYGDQDND